MPGAPHPSPFFGFTLPEDVAQAEFITQQLIFKSRNLNLPAQQR
jgi:hypothetical protein